MCLGMFHISLNHMLLKAKSPVQTATSQQQGTIMDTKILPQNFQTEDAFIFDIKGFPTLMYSENRFWMNLTNIWQWLGPIERGFLMACEVRLLMNDRNAGTYIPLDDFLSVCPRDIQTVLNTQRNRFIAMIEGEAAK